MKPKSMRLRFLKTLHALWKHTDKEHRLNLNSLNTNYLPPELSFLSRRALSETLEVMREFGLDVKRAGRGRHDGIWLDSRPLSDQDICTLTFAVSTNPYITENNANGILQKLIPFVSIYQEKLLEGCVQRSAGDCLVDDVLDTYGVIQRAIQEKCCIRVRMGYMDPADQSLLPQKKQATLSCFRQSTFKRWTEYFTLQATITNCTNARG